MQNFNSAHLYFPLDTHINPEHIPGAQSLCDTDRITHSLQQVSQTDSCAVRLKVSPLNLAWKSLNPFSPSHVAVPFLIPSTAAPRAETIKEKAKQKV